MGLPLENYLGDLQGASLPHPQMNDADQKKVADTGCYDLAPQFSTTCCKQRQYALTSDNSGKFPTFNDSMVVICAAGYERTNERKRLIMEDMSVTAWRMFEVLNRATLNAS